MSGARITVAVVDPHEVVRAGIRAGLANHEDLMVVWESAPGAPPRTLPNCTPQVMVVDPCALRSDRLPTKEAGSSRGEAAVLVYANTATPQQLREALELGVRGYILKSDPSDVLASAIRTVANGNYFISSSLSRCVRDALLAQAGESLTPREQEILQLVADGHSNKSIASLLGLSPRTVEVHRLSLLRKFGAHTGAELVRRAIRSGVLSA